MSTAVHARGLRISLHGNDAQHTSTVRSRTGPTHQVRRRDTRPQYVHIRGPRIGCLMLGLTHGFY